MDLDCSDVKQVRGWSDGEKKLGYHTWYEHYEEHKFCSTFIINSTKRALISSAICRMLLHVCYVCSLTFVCQLLSLLSSWSLEWLAETARRNHPALLRGGEVTRWRPEPDGNWTANYNSRKLKTEPFAFCSGVHIICLCTKLWKNFFCVLNCCAKRGEQFVCVRNFRAKRKNIFKLLNVRAKCRTHILWTNFSRNSFVY